MNGIFNTKRSLSGFGSYGSGLKDDVPPWCLNDADFKECFAKQAKGCTNDCTSDTWEPPADCIPKCTAAWTQIQCTPKCLAKQPVDPNPVKTAAPAQAQPFLSQASMGLPNFVWGLIGLTAVVATVVVLKR